jgi:hypothetical protein
MGLGVEVCWNYLASGSGARGPTAMHELAKLATHGPATM